MADHFSALKRARQTEKRTARNRNNNSQLRTALRSMRESLENGDKSAASSVYSATVSTLDRAVKKGILHENTASRYKSRLSTRLGALKYRPRFFLTVWVGLLYKGVLRAINLNISERPGWPLSA
jgi:small subunit ribosomal protein S20